jgi:hypothetical protein
VSINRKTIERRLLQWGVQRNLRLEDNSVIRARIAVLFYQCCLSDKNITMILEKEGH